MRISDFQPGDFFFSTTYNHVLEMIWLNDQKLKIRQCQVYNHTLKKSQLLKDIRDYHPLDRYRQKKIGKSIKPKYKRQLKLF